MEQLTMGHVVDPAQEDAWDVLERAVKEAVAVITQKELAHRLNLKPSYFSEALNGRNDKGFRLEWLPAVILMAPIGNVAEILRALADLRGFAIERRKQLTPEQENVATREWLQMKAPALLQLLDKEIGR